MVMAAYLERDDFVYPSNSDDLDFEGTVRPSPDVTLEIFDPPPPVPFSSDSETEIVEKMKITQMQMNQIHMVYKKLQCTVIPVIMKMKKIPGWLVLGLFA